MQNFKQTGFGVLLASTVIMGCSQVPPLLPQSDAPPPDASSLQGSATQTQLPQRDFSYEGARYHLQAVNTGHLINPIMGDNIINLVGYKVGTTLKVDQLRPDALTGVLTLVGSATGVVDATGKMSVNAAAGRAAALCMAPFTPTLQPGDVIQVTEGTVIENTTVAAISVQKIVQVDASTVAVKGNATNGAGIPLPFVQMEARIVSFNKVPFSNGKTVLRAPAAKSLDGVFTYDTNPTHPGDFTATFTGLSPTDISRMLSNVGLQAQGLWLGVTVPPTEETIITNPPKFAVGCAAPATNAVLSSVPTSLNAATVLAPLVLNGQADPDVVSVAVSLGGGVIHNVTLPPTIGGKIWSVTIPAAELAALPDGTIAATANFTTAGGNTFAGLPLTIGKNTLASTVTALPAGGTFNTPQTVTLSSTDPSAKIFFTTDGTVPTIASRVYNGTPIPISQTTFLRYFALGATGNVTPVATQTYTFLPITLNVKAAPTGGTFNVAQAVTLSASDPKAKIFYTTDGSVPTAAASLYTGVPIPIGATMLLKYVAINAIGLTSAVGVQTYTIAIGVPLPPPIVTPPAPPPVVTPPGVFVPKPAPFVTPSAAGAGVLTLQVGQTVHLLATNVPGSKVFYTTNGSTPTTASNLAVGPVSLPVGNVTLQFFAVSPAGAQSAVQTKFYKQL
jgi:hypothetical protein